MTRPRNWWPALLATLAALTAAATVEAQEASGFVREVLGRRIIGPGLGLEEVRAYAEALVPRMPEVRDRADWRQRSDRMRAETLRSVVFRGEAARWRELPTRVEWLGAIDGGPGYRIRKLRYEAVPGFWVPALLYEPEKLDGKVPGVVNFDGHDPQGLFADYKQVRCINLAKRGMFALNVDWIGMGQLRSDGNAHGLLNHLDLCGTSGLAVFYLLQTRAVDILLGLDHADPARIAATGLSGGGWQAIFLGAMDPRVTLTAPVAGYSSFLTRARFASDLGDSEQTPADLATVTDYALMTAMLAPRPALLTFNATDNCCFAADHALPPLLEAARPIYRLFDAEANLRTHVNHDPGTHNYLLDNRQAFYRALGDHFFPGRPAYPAVEIPSDTEVKAADQLRVPLPPANATLQALALGLARDLPRDAALPADKAAALAWQSNRRGRLADVTRSRRFTVRAEVRGTATQDGTTAHLWALRLDPSWTVPAVELTRGEPKGTTLILADSGRQGAATLAAGALARGRKVIACDPFDVGESRIAEKAWLWHLYLATVGDRPLGLHAGQVAAVARWAAERDGNPVEILADGPRSSIAALVAAALETRAIADLDLRGAPGSFKEPIETATPFDKIAGQSCFGLLEVVDVPHLVALVAPRRVTFRSPNPRVQAEMRPLEPWYAVHGLDFNPAP